MENVLPNSLLPDGFTTDRLVFERLSMDDVEEWMPFFSDDDAYIRFIGLEKAEPEVRSEKWIQKQLGRYEKGNGMMALRSRSTGLLIGQCGVLHQELDGEPVLEIAYHILSTYRGQGYASEAARACRRYVFDNEISDEVYSMIQTDNEISGKVAHRNGMLLDRETTYHGLETKVYKAEKYLKKISFGEYLGMGFVVFLILIFIGWLVSLVVG